MTNEEIQLIILEEEKKLGWCDIERYNYIIYLYELLEQGRGYDMEVLQSYK